jgi:hypothetical protein
LFPEPAQRLPVITCIIFSKDRAMQLDACLRSIERYAPYLGPILVIYHATSPKFEAGYNGLDYGPRATLIRQSEDFKRDVMDALASAGEHTIFHTDDDVFFRDALCPPALSDRFAAFSLRLGLNTTRCHTRNRPQPLPNLRRHGRLIAWKWTEAKDDFAYPMSLDGHMFQTRLVRSMLVRASFTNPNELEDELHLRRHLAPEWMLACRESCVVSNPVNVVTTTHANRAGCEPGLAPEELNRRFLAGDRIDLEAMDFSNVEAAHQEIAVSLARSGSNLS